MDRIEVGAARLAVNDRGGDGPALLALHAGVADQRVYKGCVPAWTGAGWRVITYDRRGFGQSSWQPESFSHVADLEAVMDALGVNSAVLVGNSQGGRIALDLALASPERVDGLILIGTAVTGAPYPFGAEPAPAEEELDEAADAASETGDLDRANRLEAHAWLDGPLQREGRVGGEAQRLFLDMNGRELAAPDVGEVTWGDPAWPRIEQVKAPTLIVIGAYDFTLVNEWSRELARRIPSADLIELPQSAHLPMLDDEQGFLAAVDPHLQI